MKNFKKLFNVLTAVAVLSASSVGSLNASAAYSDVVTTAYDYGYSKGMTTQGTIDAAAPMANSTKILTAKALVQRAMNVKGLKPNTAKNCEFADMAGYNGSDLLAYATKACQLGIAGIDADGNATAKFNPNVNTTKAVYVIMLNRVINGNSAGADWMAHKTQLGIVTDTRDLSLVNVTKWETWELARKADGESTVDCTSIENMLLCMPGADENCPASCKAGVNTGEKPEVKAGSLNVALNAVNTLADNAEIPSTGTVRFASVNFTASSSNDVSLKTVELKKLGLASVPTSFRVRFEKDGLRVSGKAAFTSEGTAVVSFAPMFVVKKGSTENLDLYVELAGANINQNYQFASNSFNTTAESVNGSFTSPVLRTAQYTVTPVAFDIASTGSVSNKTANGVELGAFKLENKNVDSEVKDAMFKSVTLRQAGNGDISNLTDIVLERNGEVVSKSFSINSRDITFTVNDTIKDKTSATYYIKATVNNVELVEDTYQFTLRNTTDLNVVESKTAFRSTITATVSTLGLYSIKGGELVFVRDANYPLSQTYSAGSEVVLMKGTITSKSAMTLEDPTVALSPTMTGLNDMFSTIYLQIGSSTFSYSPVATDTGAKFLGAATVDGAASVKMYATLKETAPAKTVKFEDLKLASFKVREYVSNGNSVDTAIGTIAGISVESQVAVLNVTKTDGLGNTTLAQGSSDVTVYGLKLSSTQGNGVTVSRITLAVTGNNSTGNGYADNATLTLYVNGSAVSSKTLKADNSVYFDFNQKITKAADMNVLVKATFAEAFSSGTFNMTLSALSAYDTLTSKAISGYAMPVGAKFTLNTAVGTLAESTNKPLTKLLLSPDTSVELAAFKLSATNDGVRLYDVLATGSNLSALSNFRLVTTSGKNLVAVATEVTANTVKFTAINNAPVVAKDSSASYYIVADVNTNTTTTGIALTVLASGTTIKGSNGLTLAATGVNVVSNSHSTAENTMIVTRVIQDAGAKSINGSALKFTVTAYGKNSVVMKNVAKTLSSAGYDVGTGNVYRTSVSPTNIVNFTGNVNNTIDAGSTATFIIAYDGTIASAGSTAWDRSVSVTDISFDVAASVSSFSNVGEFPLTDRK